MTLVTVFCIELLLLSYLVVNFGEAGRDPQSASLAVIHSENVKDKTSEAADVTVETEVESSEEVLETFKPTSEWKEVKKGQPIPKGLHVRLNLATGKTEAKLMDDAGKADKNEQQPYVRAELLDAMQHFTSDDVKDPKKLEAAENTFKNIDQLKKEFEDLKLYVKTDYELITFIMNNLKRPNVTDADKITMFNDLEYYVHQIDNAVDFVAMGGFLLVIPSLNSSDDEVRASAAFLLGSAMQSNPKVQIEALENALLQCLLRLIVWDASHVVRSRAMYALSTLVRHFPLAQQQLVELGGLTVLSELFRHPLHNPELTKLQVKAVTLLTDLVDEKRSTLDHLIPNDELQQEKLRQYEQVHLEQSMVELGWCNYIPVLLDVKEHDVREKVLRAMTSIAAACGIRFQEFKASLEPLVVEYCALSEAEVSKLEQPGAEDYAERYFTDLCQILQRLLRQIAGSERDEL